MCMCACMVGGELTVEVLDPMQKTFMFANTSTVLVKHADSIYIVHTYIRITLKQQIRIKVLDLHLTTK